MAQYVEHRYVPIEIVDLQPQAELPFLIYLHLPINNRVVPLGHMLTDVVAHGLRSKGMNQVYIESTDFAAFRSYVASRYTMIAGKPFDALTIMSGLLGTDAEARANSAESGKQAVEAILAGIPEFGEGLADLVRQSEHSAWVAVYAVLFAAGVGIRESSEFEDLCLAALLHDVGVGVGENQKQEDPGAAGISYLTEMGFVLNERVKRIILDNDRVEKKEWPKDAEPMLLLSQLLAIADLTDSTARGWRDGEQYNGISALRRVFEVDLKFMRNYLDMPLLEGLADWLGKSSGERFRIPGVGFFRSNRKRLSRMIGGNMGEGATKKVGNLLQYLKLLLRRVLSALSLD